MTPDIFLIILALIWLVVASIQDLKKYEILNWISFSLILFSLTYRAIYSIITNEYYFLLYGAAGFVVFFILANLFYYLRLFAGGDAKLFMALGVVLPYSNFYYENISLVISFLLIFLVTGWVYTIVSSFIFAFRIKEVTSKFREELKKSRRIFLVGILVFLVFSIVLLYLRDINFAFLPLIALLLPFLFVYARTVEKYGLVKLVSSDKLTIGDWLVEKVKIKEKRKMITVHPHWEGLTEKQLLLLRKHKKNVKVKYGIPFVPSILISFIVFLFLWYSSWSLWNFF